MAVVTLSEMIDLVEIPVHHDCEDYEYCTLLLVNPLLGDLCSTLEQCSSVKRKKRQRD